MQPKQAKYQKNPLSAVAKGALMVHTAIPQNHSANMKKHVM
jgi:hypothetical protein